MSGTERLVKAAVEAGVSDQRVLSALREVPRALFVPTESIQEAYLDEPIRISHGQVTTQPSLVAKMVEALSPSAEDLVLEIGTGLGFQTAILARLSRFVWSIERYPDLGEAARLNLNTVGVENAEVTVGDGSLGLVGQAPFDAILVSAAFPTVPPPLVQQLRPGGRLVQPIGPGGRDQVTLFEKKDDELVRRASVVPAHFVRLFGEHGFDS